MWFFVVKAAIIFPIVPHTRHCGISHVHLHTDIEWFSDVQTRLPILQSHHNNYQSSHSQMNLEQMEKLPIFSLCPSSRSDVTRKDSSGGTIYSLSGLGMIQGAMAFNGYAFSELLSFLLSQLTINYSVY